MPEIAKLGLSFEKFQVEGRPGRPTPTYYLHHRFPSIMILKPLLRWLFVKLWQYLLIMNKINTEIESHVNSIHKIWMTIRVWQQANKYITAHRGLGKILHCNFLGKISELESTSWSYTWQPSCMSSIYHVSIDIECSDSNWQISQ